MVWQKDALLRLITIWVIMVEHMSATVLLLDPLHLLQYTALHTLMLSTGVVQINPVDSVADSLSIHTQRVLVFVDWISVRDDSGLRDNFLNRTETLPIFQSIFHELGFVSSSIG